MASSEPRPTFTPGPPSCTSFDSDDDTEIDSHDAEVLGHDVHMHLPRPQSPRFVYPERRSSLYPDAHNVHADISRRSLIPHHLSGEEKQYFDNFWADFHEKRKQRQAQASADQSNAPYRADLEMDDRYYVDGHHDARAYQRARHRPPLVNLIRNGWQRDSPNSSLPDIMKDPHSNWPTLLRFLSAPRPRRWAILLLTSCIVLWIYWSRQGADVAEAWNEHRIIHNAVSGRRKSDLGWFGTNMLPEFVGMAHLKQLENDLVPRAGNDRRLIFVGDVHGCHDELEALLSEVDFKLGSDHLIFTGDLISKGPSSPEVVDLAMASHASCVRGNHEDRVLLAYRDMQAHDSLAPATDHGSHGKDVPPPPAPGNPNKAREAEPDAKVDETIDHESFTSGDHVNQQLARTFSEEQIGYLASCPVILDVGPIDGLGEVRVVHAGLVPGVSLQRQDPISVMHMRTLDLKSHVPSRVNDGFPWNKVWNEYQTLLPNEERSTVIYGHDSQRGLQLEKYSKGLDTGCIRGGKLTALIITSGDNKKPEIVSVDCQDYRPNGLKS